MINSTSFAIYTEEEYKLSFTVTIQDLRYMHDTFIKATADKVYDITYYSKSVSISALNKFYLIISNNEKISVWYGLWHLIYDQNKNRYTIEFKSNNKM